MLETPRSSILVALYILVTVTAGWGDVGEIQGRYRGDTGEIHGSYIGATGR